MKRNPPRNRNSNEVGIHEDCEAALTLVKNWTVIVLENKLHHDWLGLPIKGMTSLSHSTCRVFSPILSWPCHEDLKEGLTLKIRALERKKVYKLFIMDLTRGSHSDNSSACISFPLEHYKWALAIRGELQKHLGLGESEAIPRVCYDCRKKQHLCRKQYYLLFSLDLE